MSALSEASAAAAASDSSSDDGGAGPDWSLLSSELSPSAMAALTAHMTEAAEPSTVDDWENENFGMSQFWYDDPTRAMLSKALLARVPRGGRVALVSSPSVATALQADAAAAGVAWHVLEFDKRFGEAYPEEFEYFDFNHLDETLPAALEHQCDAVLMDPPYINEEVVAAFVKAARFLAKGPVVAAEAAEGEALTPCIFCSGVKLEDHFAEAYAWLPSPKLPLYFAVRSAVRRRRRCPLPPRLAHPAPPRPRPATATPPRPRSSPARPAPPHP